ncbi:uro-adherence factor A-like isoform X2 [Prorops nasuta]|uniref:uro-adherence factor A-like isoform X2 n=1 Tax=Prorops nasuta TaxID=863751 RepID=UPI0034CDF517
MFQSKATLALLRLKEMDKKYKVKSVDNKHVRNKISAESSFNESVSSEKSTQLKKEDKKKLDIKMPITRIENTHDLTSKKELSSSSERQTKFDDKISSESFSTLIESTKPEKEKSSEISNLNENHTTIEEDVRTIDEKISSIAEDSDSQELSVSGLQNVKRETTVSEYKGIETDDNGRVKDDNETDYTSDTFENVSSSQILTSANDENRLGEESVKSETAVQKDGSTVLGVRQIDIVPRVQRAKYISDRESSTKEKTRTDKKVIELVAPKPIEAVISELELDLDKDLSDYVKSIETSGREDIQPICLLKKSRGVSFTVQSKKQRDHRLNNSSRSESGNSAIVKNGSNGNGVSKNDRETSIAKASCRSHAHSQAEETSEKSISKKEKDLRNLISAKKEGLSKHKKSKKSEEKFERSIGKSKVISRRLENGSGSRADETEFSDDERSISVSIGRREECKRALGKKLDHEMIVASSNEKLEENMAGTKTCQSIDAEAITIGDKKLKTEHRVMTMVKEAGPSNREKEELKKDTAAGEFMKTLGDQFSERLLQELTTEGDVVQILRKLNRDAINALFRRVQTIPNKKLDRRRSNNSNSSSQHSSSVVRINKGNDSRRSLKNPRTERAVNGAVNSRQTKNKKSKKHRQSSRTNKSDSADNVNKNRESRLESKYINELRMELVRLRQEREEMRNYILKLGQMAPEYASKDSFATPPNEHAIKPLDFPNIAKFARPDTSDLYAGDNYEIYRERVLSIRQWIKDQYIFYRSSSDMAQIINTKYIPATLKEAKKFVDCSEQQR